MPQGDNGSNCPPHNDFRSHRGFTEAGIEVREAGTKETKAMTMDTELEFKETEMDSHMNLPEPRLPMV